MQRIHTFSAGTHTAMSGQAVTITAADLAATAAAYDPALSEAPIVVGHPATDDPAYGWVQSLQVGGDQGQELLAVPHQVNAEFAQMVKGGAYKKVSASFYAPNNPNNPKPGVYYLRHIGFLGAQPPAVKGLRGPEFADAADADHADQLVSVEIAFSEGPGSVPPAPQPTTTPTTPPATPPQGSLSMSEAEIAALKAESLALKAERDTLKAEGAALKAAQASAAHAAQTAQHTAFCEKLVAEARLPADKLPLAVALLDFCEPAAVAGAEPAVVEFGEGAAKAPLGQHLKAFLQALAPKVAFAEVATTGRAAAGGAAGAAGGATGAAAQAQRRQKLLDKARAEFGEGAAPERLETHVDTLLYAEANSVSYAQALQVVMAQD